MSYPELLSPEEKLAHARSLGKPVRFVHAEVAAEFDGADVDSRRASR